MTTGSILGQSPSWPTCTKQGMRSRLTSPAPRPGQGAINTPLDSTKSMVYAVVRCILGADIPNTGGYFRPVTVTAPLGTFVNPEPASPGGRPLPRLPAG